MMPVTLIFEHMDLMLHIVMSEKNILNLMWLQYVVSSFGWSGETPPRMAYVMYIYI